MFRDTDIAVIGMSCRFPGANNPSEYWNNLLNGVCSTSFFTSDELEASGVESNLLKDSGFVPAYNLVENPDHFDASFFGFTPKEAEFLDPQSRLFFETAWEAMECSGYRTEKVPGTVGVFAGMGLDLDFALEIFDNRDYLYDSFGADRLFSSIQSHSFLTTQTSHLLNLKGPSVNVNTACSTSLVAIHLACQSILNGECYMAMAGGAEMMHIKKTGYLHRTGGIYSPDGYCRVFDEQAEGTTPGNGVGIVVLKRLVDAIDDGDYIHAVIKGTAVNNDGSAKLGFTAPSVEGQSSVIAEAIAIADVEPDSIQYVEAHGTGTRLGDPVEIQALTQVYGKGNQKKQYCAVGSVKSNFGHLGCAAGVAGFIKSVLALSNGKIPPTLHYDKPNPNIDFENSPFYVAKKLGEWTENGHPRRAAVSSFGIGGTNAHIILEQAPAMVDERTDVSNNLIVLSAQSEIALDEVSQRLAVEMEKRPELMYRDVAYTLAVGRKGFNYRSSFQAFSRENAVANLKKGARHAQFIGKDSGKVIFLFSGQGTQYRGMGKPLYHEVAEFREAFEACRVIVSRIVGIDIYQITFEEIENDSNAINRTDNAQLALFCIEYSLVCMWRAWGVVPHAMIGHSLGEYVAACIAGVFSLEDALKLVCTRGRLMRNAPSGKMIAVGVSRDAVDAIVSSQGVDYAAFNTARMCVISGETDRISNVERILREKGIDFKELKTSHAFHSILMEEVLPEFRSELRSIKFSIPTIPYISNVTGNWILDSEAQDPEYWLSHIRKPVDFLAGMETLSEIENGVFLEIGPGDTLTRFAQSVLGIERKGHAIASISHVKSEEDDYALVQESLGRLWSLGANIDWEAFYGEKENRRVPLPTYPFERKRYWIDIPESERLKARSEKRNSKVEMTLNDWFYMPAWEQSPMPVRNQADRQIDGTFVLFVDSSGICQELADTLSSRGARVVRINKREHFKQISTDCFSVSSDLNSDLSQLTEIANFDPALPIHVIHGWLLDTLDGNDDPDLWKKDGIYSLTAMMQWLGQFSSKYTLNVSLLSTGVYDVLGIEKMESLKSTSIGFIKVASVEYPHVKFKYVDISLDEVHVNSRKVAEEVVEELLSKSDQSSPIAYRCGRRWELGYRQTHIDPQLATDRLKDGGVYLITGGLGGIGLSLALYLVERCSAKVALIGRSEIPEREQWSDILADPSTDKVLAEKLELAKSLPFSEGRALYLSCDIACRDSLSAVIAKIHKKWGQINGVIHSAGVADYEGVIQARSQESLDRVYKVKVDGTLNLDSLLKENPLDFFVSFSSLATVAYHLKYGQVGYNVANEFLDAFSHERAKREKGLTLTINWADWKTVGMTEKAKDFWRQKNAISIDEEDEEAALSVEDGIAVFENALGSTSPQVLISRKHLEIHIEETRRTYMALQDDAQQFSIGKESKERPKLLSPYVEPSTEIEKNIITIFEELLGVNGVGADDSFFELGGNSLIGVQAMVRIKDLTSYQLSVGELFNYSSAKEIAALIGGDIVSDAPKLNDEREEIVL